MGIQGLKLQLNLLRPLIMCRFRSLSRSAKNGCGTRGVARIARNEKTSGTYVGESFVSTNGILQGCLPLSVMLLNALMCALTIILE